MGGFAGLWSFSPTETEFGRGNTVGKAEPTHKGGFLRSIFYLLKVMIFGTKVTVMLAVTHARKTNTNRQGQHLAAC